MKRLVLLFLWCWPLLSWSQNVVQLKIIVNPDLTVLSDVTATPDSIPHGRHRIIYKNRTLVKGSVRDGLMDGVWTTYYTNGQQKMKGRFSLGQPHGEWVYWGINGDVQAKFQYNKGKKIGHWQGYYYNHAKAIDIIYNSKNNPEQCIHYYQDEIIALNHEYSYDSKSTYANLSYYYKNYNIFHYEQLKDDINHGSLISYHDNGLVWESYYYDEGKLLKVNKGFSNGGSPRRNDNFRNGNGIINKYYITGNLYSKTTYKNGLKNDSIVIYDLGGKMSGKGSFKNGIPYGTWKIYSKFHKLNVTLEVQPQPNLAFVTHHISLAPKEVEYGYMLDGYRHGTWKQYNSYGELLTETNHRFGLKHGVAKRYQSGKTMEVFHYTNDNKDGDFTFYSTFNEINSQETFESEDYLDTNWYKSPHEDWIKVLNPTKETHQKRMWFYPALPGMEIIEQSLGFIGQKEGMFHVQRNIPYNYWPELIPAQFDGGNIAEKEYIRKYLTIPDSSIDKHVNGKVLLRYKVDHIGLLSEIVVLKSVGFGLDEVAIDMIKSFPPQNPATFNGIPIPSYVIREFDFKY